jgi:hypothetical protein
MSALRRLYGAGPLQLLALAASFLLAAAALSRLLDAGAASRNVLLWLVGAILLHDLVLFPLTALLDRIAGAAPSVRGVPAVNYLRVPATFAGLLFLVWFPLILGLSDARYESSARLSTDVFLPRWLAISGALFAASAVLYALRLRRAR